jgi:hypothetical protein
VEAAQQQAEAANEAAKAAANVAAVSSQAQMQTSQQNVQIVGAISTGNQNLLAEMEQMNRQFREFRAELPDAVNAAIQQGMVG